MAGSESRQQRRARERSERKDAARSGPNPPPRPAKVMEIDLARYEGQDAAGAYVSWSAEWGLHDSSSGTEDSDEDLPTLVARILADIRSTAERYELRLEWTLTGDARAGKTLEQEVAELGVQLPDRV